MAAIAAIVQEMLDECGKSSSDVRRRIENKANEVVLELLNLHQGQHERLKELSSLTFASGEDSVRVDSRFNTAAQLWETDLDGKFSAKCTIDTKAGVFRQIVDAAYHKYRLAYLDELTVSGQRALYLVLAEAVTSTIYMMFEWYRQPTVHDAGIIKSDAIIKQGIRAGMPKLFPGPGAGYHAAIYERRKEGFHPERHKRITSMRIVPSKRTRRYNKHLSDIGQGG